MGDRGVLKCLFRPSLFAQNSSRILHQVVPLNTSPASISPLAPCRPAEHQKRQRRKSMEHADAVHRRKTGLTFAFVVFAAAGSAQTPVTIRAGTMLDGKGGIQRNVRITIEGSKILRVEPGAGGAVTYDLSSLTLMPGWIDTHVHLNGHFNKAGKADNRGESPAEYALRME